jgi:uncharacterized protein (DUF1330 family)
MSVYIIAQISITDRDRYNKYQARFLEVFAKFSGQLLAADEKPEVIEGDWNREKVVLMKFPDKESFEAWAYSPEYQEIAGDRKAGSDGVFLLVRSFNL